MFTYANPYDGEPRVAEGDQVDVMYIVLDVVDEFASALYRYGDSFLQSVSFIHVCVWPCPFEC